MAVGVVHASTGNPPTAQAAAIIAYRDRTEHEVVTLVGKFTEGDASSLKTHVETRPYKRAEHAGAACSLTKPLTSTGAQPRCHCCSL